MLHTEVIYTCVALKCNAPYYFAHFVMENKEMFSCNGFVCRQCAITTEYYSTHSYAMWMVCSDAVY